MKFWNTYVLLGKKSTLNSRYSVLTEESRQIICRSDGPATHTLSFAYAKVFYPPCVQALCEKNETKCEDALPFVQEFADWSPSVTTLNEHYCKLLYDHLWNCTIFLLLMAFWIEPHFFIFQGTWLLWLQGLHGFNCSLTKIRVANLKNVNINMSTACFSVATGGRGSPKSTIQAQKQPSSSY